jgi:hypothetical protein
VTLLRAAAVLAVLLPVGGLLWLRSIRPSHERDWAPEQARLATAVFDGPRVTVRNVRNFAYPAAGGVIERWEDRVYDLEALESAWYVIAPFSTDWRGPAHAFVSFGFSDGRHLAVSVEARRERGESYSMLGGMLRRFELIYVVGDERDLIGVRVNRQGDEVFVYPVRATRDGVRRLFTDMMQAANGIAARPRFYDTLRRNCTTLLLAHVNAVLDRPIRWSPRILLPGYSDAVAYRRGLIDTPLPLDAARARHRVNDAAARWPDAPDFSQRIRAPFAAGGAGAAGP